MVQVHFVDPDLEPNYLALEISVHLLDFVPGLGNSGYL